MSTIAKIFFLIFLPVVSAFSAAPQVAIVDLQNVQCYACLNTVKKALQNVPGVQDAQLDLDKKTATVKFDPAKTHIEALTQATAKAGFPSAVRKQVSN